jgi:hypothetical protein
MFFGVPWIISLVAVRGKTHPDPKEGGFFPLPVCWFIIIYL